MSLTISHELKQQRVARVNGDAAVAKAHGRHLQPVFLAVLHVCELVARAAHLCSRRGEARVSVRATCSARRGKQRCNMHDVCRLRSSVHAATRSQRRTQPDDLK